VNPRRKTPQAKRESPLSQEHQREPTVREWIDGEEKAGADPRWVAMWRRLIEYTELAPGADKAEAFSDVCGHLVAAGALKEIPAKGVANQF
jgi:hypothetical protein